MFTLINYNAVYRLHLVIKAIYFRQKEREDDGFKFKMRGYLDEK